MSMLIALDPRGIDLAYPTELERRSALPHNLLARGRPWRGGRRHCLALAAAERPWWLRDAGAVMTLQPWEGRRERECGLAMITSGVRQALRTGEREKASDC